MKARKLSEHPNHRKHISRVRRIRGQVEAIERMIDEKRYCPDIITQIRAAASALRALESTVLESHFQHCVKDTFESANEAEKKRKIKEIMRLFSRN